MAKVILTRALEDSQSFAAELIANGIEQPVIFPCLEFIEPADKFAGLDAAIRRNPDYSWIVFLSQKSAEVFFERLLAIGGHTFHLHTGLKIAVIGDSTRKFIETEIGFPVDFVPSEFNSDVFVREFGKMLLATGISEMRILLPRTAMVNDDFVESLRQASCRDIDLVEAYSTKCPTGVSTPELEAALTEGALISFTSSQIVRNFMTLTSALDRELLASAEILSLGPKTTKTINEYSLFKRIREAKPSTLATMLNMIKSSRDEQSKTRS